MVQDESICPGDLPDAVRADLLKIVKHRLSVHPVKIQADIEVFFGFFVLFCFVLFCFVLFCFVLFSLPLLLSPPPSFSPFSFLLSSRSNASPTKESKQSNPPSEQGSRKEKNKSMMSRFSCSPPRCILCLLLPLIPPMG